MNELNDIYQDLIIDHSNSPKNFGELTDRSHTAKGHNPLCGDIIDVDLLIKDDVVEKIAFRGDGCAISKASASLMTMIVEKKTIAEVKKTFNSFHSMLTDDQASSDGLGKLKVLEGVKRFPVRVKCATLCWHTLDAALNKKQDVTTE